MTLQQLRYAIIVAETGKITEAANKLYISQPSLTNSIHELEKEMNIVIFNRTNKGITVSKEGEIFLAYARQILEQVAILEDKFKRNDGGKKQFCVSTQHYSFAVNAFVDLIKEYGQNEYDFSLRETQTYEIIEDVAHMRSEIGILFLNDFNETVASLFKGMDSFLSAKTVVGEAVHVNDTIILPLVDVSFGVGAGAFAGDKKNNAGGGMGGKMSPSAVLVIQNGATKLVNIKNQDTVTKILDMVPDVVDRITGKFGDVKMDDDIDEAISDVTDEE